MKNYTEEEAMQATAQAGQSDDLSNTDNDGQVVIYTGVYAWKHDDGSITYHDEPSPDNEATDEA